MSAAVPSEVFRAVSEAFGVNIADLIGPRRPPRFAIPRLATYKLLRGLPNMSLAEIAFICGRSDHTTVLKGIQKAEKLIARDEFFSAAYYSALRAINHGTPKTCQTSE